MTYQQQRDALSPIERAHLTALESLPHSLVLRQLERPTGYPDDQLLPGIDTLRNVWTCYIAGLSVDRAEDVRQAARL